MKIIHVSVARKLHGGQRKQIEYEYIAAGKLSGASWDVVGYDDYKSEYPFMKQVPVFFRFMFLRNLYGWIVLLRYSRKYDYILVRNMTFDPFSFIFSPFIKNRISIHHAKEVEELKLVRKGWRGTFASALERRSGAFALRYAVAIAGVTNEIANYEKERSGSSSKTILYPNGINNTDINLIKDKRHPGILNIAFMCIEFSEWHGLDKFINRIKNYKGSILEKIENVNLIGLVPDNYIELINSDDALKNLFNFHGILSEMEYRKVLDTCDIGLSSFALERKGLSEACTLKVREMLAMGLPVYSGHIDCAIPEEFQYYLYDEEINIESMIEFGFLMKGIDRKIVSSSSKKYIDKGSLMNNMLESIKVL